MSHICGMDSVCCLRATRDSRENNCAHESVKSNSRAGQFQQKASKLQTLVGFFWNPIGCKQWHTREGFDRPPPPEPGKKLSQKHDIISEGSSFSNTFPKIDKNSNFYRIFIKISPISCVFRPNARKFTSGFLNILKNRLK